MSSTALSPHVRQAHGVPSVRRGGGEATRKSVGVEKFAKSFGRPEPIG